MVLFLFSLSHKFLSDFNGFVLDILHNLDPSKARFFFAPASGARDALVSILEGCAHKHCIRDVTLHTSVTSDEVKYTSH